MASGTEFDQAQLSEPQQEALQQYIALTNQEAKDAVPLLERSQWNVQVRPHYWGVFVPKTNGLNRIHTPSR